MRPMVLLAFVIWNKDIFIFQLLHWRGERRARFGTGPCISISCLWPVDRRAGIWTETDWLKVNKSSVILSKGKENTWSDSANQILFSIWKHWHISAVTVDYSWLTFTHSQRSECFRGEVHRGRETVVYSRWVWEVFREEQLQELEVKHSV